MGDNPHDRTDPRVSTAILTAHPRDGVAMLMKERLPEQIIEIVRSHHGDTPVMYFYNKSRMENGGDVDVNDFRYDGPRPISREAAIVMMADTVEAAARSMPNPDSEKLNQLIRNLVRQKTDDGQLDNCQLTFADIDKICTSFYTVLSGVFHERIEYPSIEIPHFRARVLTESAQADAARKEEEKKEEGAPSEKAPAEEKNEAEAAVENAPAEGKQAPSEEAVKEETPSEEAVKEETPEKENAPKEETDGAEDKGLQADENQTEEK